jgi:hypothetical protein
VLNTVHNYTVTTVSNNKNNNSRTPIMNCIQILNTDVTLCIKKIYKTMEKNVIGAKCNKYKIVYYSVTEEKCKGVVMG